MKTDIIEQRPFENDFADLNAQSETLIYKPNYRPVEVDDGIWDDIRRLDANESHQLVRDEKRRFTSRHFVIASIGTLVVLIAILFCIFEIKNYLSTRSAQRAV